MPQPTDGVLRKLRWPLAGLVALLIYGTAGFMVLDHGFVDAMYQAILVITTVGFADIGGTSSGERVFTASLAGLGVAVFLAALALFATAVAEGRIGHVSRRRRMQRRIDSLKEHFIVCAYGRVGRAVSREFEAEGVPFMVVDRLAELEDRMRSDGVAYLIGDPTLEGVLREAGIERARGLISAVDSDADNVYITLTARSMRPELFIVARASESAAAARLYRAGADRVMSPYVSIGRHMAQLALRPLVVDSLDIGGDDVRLDEVVVDDDSPLRGRRLDEAAGEAVPVLLQRGGDAIARPDAGEVLRAGDILVVLERAKRRG